MRRDSMKTMMALAAAAMLGAVGPAGARQITAQDLATLDRVSDGRISPDGTKALYDLATTDLAANKRSHAIWMVSTDGKGAPTKLADGSSPRWAPDGASVYFLDKGQVWRRDGVGPGGGVQQITKLPLDVDSFRIAPDGETLVVSMAVFPDAEDPAATKARLDEWAKTKASGKVYDKLFIRHWDTWADGTKNHLFALKLTPTGAAAAPVPLMKGFDGDAPGKPFGGDEDYDISPDSKTVVFSARVAGTTEPWSTNFDVYAVPIDGSAAPENYTAENKAWDAVTTFSPDGKFAAHRAMKRPGFEADRFGVILYEAATKTVREIDPTWDRSAEKIVFSGDDKSLYVLATDDGRNRLFQMDAKTGAVKLLTGDLHVGDFDVAHTKGGDVILLSHEAMNAPSQLYVLRPGRGAPIPITHANEDKLKGVAFAAYSRFSFKGWNGETVKGWITKPQGWREGVKYPVVLMIHGGPQGSWEDSWSYRWNPQVWAGWGYAVINIDFHGSTGYGQAFTDAISGHWGDRPLEDLQKGWAAALAQNPWIDGTRACAAGASYGGYMTYWIAGVWNAPFKCLVDHDGVFDDRMMGYETEELWFSEWEHDHATVWENPANYEKFNPIDHVKDWSKPILVIHSAKDFRIPLDQGIAAFTAAQRKGIPSEFLTFPDENHWVLKPANSILWHETVEAWLKRWNPPN
jgi:acylaminoacyl-peptidase